MEERKTNWLLILLIVVLVIAAIVGSFFLGKHFESKNNKNVGESINVEDRNNNSEMTDKNIDDLGKSLYDRLKSASNVSFEYDYAIPFYDFNNKIVDYNRITNSDKLISAFKLIDFKFYEIRNVDRENPEVSKCNELWENYPDECYKNYYTLKVKSNILEEKYKILFGLNKELANENFDVFVKLSDESMFLANCKIFGDDLLCILFDGGNWITDTSYTKYEKSVLENEKLYVYVKGLNYTTGYIKEDKDKFIINNEMMDKEPDSYDETFGDYLFKNFGDKAIDFKLTFEKDTDGNWYWVQTEKLD